MDTSKIIRGVVSNGRYTVTAPIVKEDYGLYLQIEGVELPSTYEVDFSNSESSGTSVTMIGNADGVLIPRQFIDSGKDVFAFLYHVGANYGRTVYKFRIPNKIRPDRTDDTPAPEQASVIDQAISALNDAVAQTAQDVISADQSAQSAKEDADRAEQARDTAQGYASNAQLSATQANNSAISANQSASASAQSASQSAQIKADVEDLADDAQASANASAQSASQASASEQGCARAVLDAASAAAIARARADEASGYAQTASAKAQEASTSAQTASQKATESANSASQASGYAQTAETAKTDAQTAKTQAETARDEAVTAKTAAETAQGKAEDAQAAAESVAESIPSDYSQLSEDVSDLKEGLSGMTTATAEDVGKALKAKTVTDGKVVEWEFGEAGGNSEAIEELTTEMAMVITKTQKPAPVPTEITQCVDLTDAKANGSYYYNVRIDVPWIGRYDMNPNNQNMRFYYMKAYDKDGNQLQLYRNGEAWGLINSETGGYFVKIDERTIEAYTSNGTRAWIWTADGDIAYLYEPSRFKGCLGDVTESGQLIGVTYAGSSETYVPYEAIDPDVPVEYDYSPNPDYVDGIQEYFGASGFIDKTLSIEGSAADAKAVGDELYDRKGITFDTVVGWIRPSNGVLITNTGNTATDFIPVTPGEVIRVNRPNIEKFTDNAYYNASKQYVSGFDTLYNVNDITIPIGVYYARFSDYDSGMVGFSVERTGLWTRIRDAIDESGDTVEYRHLIEQSKYGTDVLTLLHFSDLHMDTSTMIYINGFRTKYAEFLDDVIQTGDVSNGFSDNWSALVNVGLGDCLGVIGNHEALGSSKNSATQQELYEKYIEPYISGWNVTQPTGVDDSTSEHYCANYYYKDYTTATIRLIVLDTQKWSSAQLTWFTSTLASARTAGYAVIVASHILPGKVTITDCNFSAKYESGSNVPHTFPTSDAPLATDEAVSAVNDFITAGGEFTIWIGGHVHADVFGVFTDYPNVTAYMIDKASIGRGTPGAARIRGEKNQHAFNIMSIMRGGKLIKFVRIGEDVDGMMRGKHVFCYNYNTKTVISQW